MRIVGSYEAKTHFSKLLSEVSQGEKIVITKNGKAVARLVPIEEEVIMGREEVVGRMRRLRKKLAMRKITISDILEFKKEGQK